MINVGIIGLGGIGAAHAAALAELPDRVRLLGYSGSGAAAQHPSARRLSPSELINHPDIQVLAICTPSDTHAELALAALDAGKHVLVEKPVATSLADAEAVAARARAAGRLVSVLAQRRFEPEYRHLHRVLATEGLGALRLVTTEVHWWREHDYYRAAPWRAQAAGGGAVMNQGVHNVDLLRWLCGPVTRVTAQQATLGHEIEAEDTTVATLGFASGALGTLSISTATPPGRPATISLYGSRGSVELGQGEVLRWDVPEVEPPPEAAVVGSGAADPAAIGHLGHLQQWQDVLDALDTGRPPAIDVEDGVETVRLIDAVYRAAATGSTITLG